MFRSLRRLLPLLFLLGLVPPASAQQSVLPCYRVTGGCTDVSATNPLPVSASVSASITGFAPASTGTPISVTTGGVTGSLPAGAVVVASNVGATNGAYCKLGASATTSDQLIPPNSWFAFTVGAATQLTCITSTSTTTVNMVGGSGLPTGAGGGGGGSGGAITAASGSYSSGALASGSIASGAVSSGAYASGSVASGAFASGSLATGSMVDLLTFQGSKAAGTAAANSLLTGGVYNSSPLTLTTGQQASIQLDANGYAKVNVAAGAAGGGAVYGPTANGSAAANPPVIIGGTSTGGATGNVANATVIAGNSATTTMPAIVVADPNLLAAATASIPAGTNVIGHIIADTGSTTAVTALPATPAGTNTIGKVGQDFSTAASAPINVSTATTTQLVALSGSTKVYVTSFDVIAGGTGNITFEYGTGSACGTGTTVLTGAYNLTAQAGISKGSGLGPVLVVPAGNALCVLTSAAVQMSGSVSYQQY